MDLKIEAEDLKVMLEQLGYIKPIRCKDCKHTYLSDNFGITSPWLMCKGRIGNTWKCDPEGYCDRAERKEE